MRDLTVSSSADAIRRSPAPDYFGLASALVRQEVDQHFGYTEPASQPTEAEIDALYAAEMERRNQPPVRVEPFPNQD